MFSDLVAFGQQVFAAIILIISAGITANICHGPGTVRSRDTFVKLVLILIVGVQFYHIIYAGIYVPADKFWTFNVSKPIVVTSQILAN